MIERNGFIKFLVVATVTAFGAHLLTAASATFAIHTLYSHRIFNVRAWSDDGAERVQLVGSFLVENAEQATKPLIVFAGSSVMYGYPWDERFVFTHLFAEQKPASKVINASIVAADIKGVNDGIVCSALGNRIRFDAVVIEVPVVNTTSHLVQSRKSGHRAAPLQQCGADQDDSTYFELAVRHPRGIGWLRFLWNSEARETVESTIRTGPVPRDYFATAADFEAIRQDYADRIRETLTNAQQMAEVVYAFPSPIYLGGLEEIGEDEPGIRHQLQTAVDSCASVPGVRCLDTAAIWMNRSYFFNLTHLNQAGHRAVADLLAAEIESPPHDDSR